MRKTICASILVLALCGSAFAGDAGCPPIAPDDAGTPPLPAGDISSPPSATQSSDDLTADGLVEAALDILDTVLALF